jgi:hypothetical protein
MTLVIVVFLFEILAVAGDFVRTCFAQDPSPGTAMRAMIRDWADGPPGSEEPAPEPDAGPS